MSLSRLVVLCPLVLLVACGGNPQTQSGLQVGLGDGGYPFTPDAKAADGQTAMAVPNVREPARLKGLSPIQVKSVLGRPAFTRHDSPAEIWQYRGRGCTLDLFLYDEGGGPVVAHYAVRSPQPVDERTCFDELTARNRGTPLS